MKRSIWAGIAAFLLAIVIFSAFIYEPSREWIAQAYDHYGLPCIVIAAAAFIGFIIFAALETNGGDELGP